MTIEDREYLFDQAQKLAEILNEETTELLGMLETIEDRVAISRKINKLELDLDGKLYGSLQQPVQKVEAEIVPQPQVNQQ